MKASRTYVLFLFSLTTLLAVGCGGGSEISDGRVPASGTITLDGKPLESGSVGFLGEGGASGVGIVKNGGFSVSQSANSTGIMPGSYKVTVTSWKIEPGFEAPDGSINMEGESAISAKYSSAEKSGLTATVAEDGSSDIVIELTSGK